MKSCLVANRLEDARAHAEKALALARERGERGVEARVLCLMGDIIGRSCAGTPEACVPRYEEALELAEQLGMESLSARCRLCLEEARNP